MVQVGGLVGDRGSLTWLPYLQAAILPLAVFAFVITGPHRWPVAMLWMAFPYALVLLERRQGTFVTQPEVPPRGWHFTALLFAVGALYLVNLFLLLRMTVRGGFWRMDTVAAFGFFGVYSAFSGIVVGHELVHRRGGRDRLFGRVLCAMILYEHFYTEHVRGHHARAATEEDPATARFGETYEQYFRRAVPDQWRSAFQLECRRLRIEGQGWVNRRQLRNRVVHGLLFEALLMGAILVGFGPAALGVFLLQACSGVRYLEAVNYFQHWGLRRRSSGVHEQDAWETPARFTVFAMFGLSRHADHHLHPSRPYQQLELAEESPMLVRGYLGTLLMVLYRNRTLRDEMTGELRRLGLGPFAADQSPVPR
jgi:alkane 1-monooxygenase